MPTVQSLKKKLRVIRSTQKLTKAMKNASTVKYSKLSTLYGDYVGYESQCASVYNICRSGFGAYFAGADKNAPLCYVVLTSNKGMNGSFNPDILAFVDNIIKSEKEQPHVYVCGRKGHEYFRNKKLAFEKFCELSDVPSYEEASALFEDILSLVKNGKASGVKLIYPEYVNMMVQKPRCAALYESSDEKSSSDEDILFLPDKETFTANTAGRILVSVIYKKMLETALGAQAATLTAMRSAYDTACEYCEQLERDINRKRQSQVTSDVIESSSEFSQGGMLNG